MKTRRFLGWVAMAAMFLGTGCSSDEVVNDYSQDNAIQFGTYVGRDAQSRAHSIKVEQLAEEGFGVFAYYTETTPFSSYSSAPNFMKNQLVKGVSTTTGEGASATTTYSTTEWTYSPLKYWPNNKNHMVTFLAYAPYEVNKTIKDGTNSTIEYTISTDVAEQKDILYVDQKSSTTEKYPSTIDMTKQDVESTVHFHFLHALSRIGFDAEVMVDKVNADNTGDDNDGDEQNKVELDAFTTITINSVKLVGKFYSDGDLVLTNGGWSDVTLPTEAKTIELKKTEATTGTEGVNHFEENANVFTSTDEYNNRKLNNDESYIMIIPQDFTNVETNGSLKVIVDYDVVTIDPAFDTTQGAGDGKVAVKNVIESEPFTINFEQGKAYTFTLHLGMTSVKLTASVGDWTDAGDIAVNVPINTTTTPNP